LLKKDKKGQNRNTEFCPFYFPSPAAAINLNQTAWYSSRDAVTLLNKDRQEPPTIFMEQQFHVSPDEFR
jgi:hypothetical protein